MNTRLFFFVALSLHVLAASSQVTKQRMDDYLRKNKIPHYSYKDSLKERNKAGYIYTNRKGQTTISLPKGAIDMSVPVGDSVVYGMIKSPSFTEEVKGQVIITEYAEGAEPKIHFLDMGKLNASVGLRVDWSVDNKEIPSMNLYFLGGNVMIFPLKKSPDKIIQAYFLNENLKSVKTGQTVRTCLLYEDTKEGAVGRKLEQWSRKLDEDGLVAKVVAELKSCYVLSYKVSNFCMEER